MTTNENVIKWIRIAIEGAFLLTFIFLCVAVGLKNKKLKQYKEGVAYQTELIASANARADSLAKLNCISVTSNVIVNQKGLVNLQQATQISKSVATATRDEVLNAMDSLNKINNTK